MFTRYDSVALVYFVLSVVRFSFESPALVTCGIHSRVVSFWIGKVADNVSADNNPTETLRLYITREENIFRFE